MKVKYRGIFGHENVMTEDDDMMLGHRPPHQRSKIEEPKTPKVYWATKGFVSMGRAGEIVCKVYYTIWLFNIAMENHHF
jgi:hypothetical protein